MLVSLGRVYQRHQSISRTPVALLKRACIPRSISTAIHSTPIRIMATPTQPADHGKTREITSLNELATILRAGPLPPGFSATTGLLDEIEGKLENPTPDQAFALFKAIERKFPHSTLGEDKWYLVALSALVGAEPELSGTLYSHLINQPQFSTSESRQALVRRLREALVKSVSVQGVCKPLEALFSIVKVEKPEDQDYSFSREHWNNGPENRARGEAWLNKIYEQNLSVAADKFKAHKDFDFISREITYGFYLSDHSILGPIETELVVLSGIMIQNLPLETAWHLRGTRRVGVSKENVELIQQCVELVAKFGGLKLHKVPRVADIEHEV